MKITYALLLATLTAATSATAHAGLYEERQQESYRRAEAQSRNQEAANVAAEYARHGRLVYGFLAKLGGAAEGTCTVSPYSCYNGSCGQGAYAKVPAYGMGSGAYYFNGCTVTLNDGQACVINRHLNTSTWNYDGLVAYCYDANSVRREYHFPGGGVRGVKKPLRKKR